MTNILIKVKQLGFRFTMENLWRRIRFLRDDMLIILKGYNDPFIVPYIGFVGQMNLGDEILFDSHAALLKKVKLRHINYLMTLKIATRLKKPFFRYAVLGGGTLIDHSNNWIDRVECLQSNGTKLFCLGTGVEDISYWPEVINKSAHMERWKSALEKFIFVGIRGPISLKILEKYGVENARITGDTALSMYKSNSGLNQRQGQVHTAKNKLTVGISYGATVGQKVWGDAEIYRRNIIEIINALLAKGYRVVLLPIWNLDTKSNAEIVKEVNHKNCELIIAYENYSDYMQELSKTNYFIGQKLHASVMSLMCGVPTIMVEYHPKCKDFMASVKAEKYVIKTSEIDEMTFFKLFTNLQRESPSIMPVVSSRMRSYQDLQMISADKIAKKILDIKV